MKRHRHDEDGGGEEEEEEGERPGAGYTWDEHDQTLTVRSGHSQPSAAGRLLERTRVSGFGADGELVGLATDR